MYSTFSNEIAAERVTDLRQHAAKARLAREATRGRTTIRGPRPAAA
jgi:hypothetical protein